MSPPSIKGASDLPEVQFEPSQQIVLDFIVWLWGLRRLLLINFLVTLIAASIYAFVVATPYFVSSITFLPPVGSDGSFAFLKGLEGFSMPSSQDVSSDQIQAIFNGMTFRRSLVDKFDLIRRYERKKQVNPYEQSMKLLAKHMELQTDEISGLGSSTITAFTIHAEDRSADTALALARASFAQLDSAVQEISVDRSHQRRIFIESQIRLRELQLDSAQAQLTAFQKTHKIFSVQDQSRATFDALGDLEVQAMKLETQRDFFGASQGVSGSAYRQIQVSLEALQRQKRQLEQRTQADILPGIMNAADLAPQYLKLTKLVDARVKVLEFLFQQCESERIAEAKLVSRLKVIDQPWKAEYKSKPKRTLLLVGIVVVQGVFLLSLCLAWFYFKHRIQPHPFWRSVITSLKQ